MRAIVVTDQASGTAGMKLTTTDLPLVCHWCRFVFRTSGVISPTQNPEPIKPVPPTTTTV